MPTAPYYPPSVLPWQDCSFFERPGRYSWEIGLVDLDREGLAYLSVSQDELDRWFWTILPCDFTYPIIGGDLFTTYGDYDECEAALLAALAEWLHAPPSPHLPPQEGATEPRKEV